MRPDSRCKATRQRAAATEGTASVEASEDEGVGEDGEDWEGERMDADKDMTYVCEDTRGER